MKTAILITLSAMVIAVAAFLALNNDLLIQRPDEPLFDGNNQALSNGLIAIDKKLIPEANSRVAGHYDAACAFCHDLPDPASHDALEWEFVVDRMEGLIIELSEKENRVVLPWDGGIKKELLTYLERYSFKGMNPDDLPDKPEKGAKLFKEVCAMCHTLPDPSMHSLDVWEYVISKMQSFQNEMGLTVMTEEEATAVLEYLGENRRVSSAHHK